MKRKISEKMIEDYLVCRVEEVGGATRKLKWIGRRSAPDRLVAFVTGWNGLVEVKKPGEKPRADQKREHALLAALGVNIRVIDSFEDVNTLISKHGVKR